MTITVTTNRNSIAVQYGFIGFKLDLNEIEPTIKTIQTVVKHFAVTDQEDIEDFMLKTHKILDFIVTAKKCISIKTIMEDFETIMELEIDDKTLMGKAKFIKLPTQDPNMEITIDYMAIGNLIKEGIEFINYPDGRPEEEPVRTEEKEEKSETKIQSYSTIYDMSKYVDKIIAESEVEPNKDLIMSLLQRRYPKNTYSEWVLAYEYSSEDSI